MIKVCPVPGCEAVFHNCEKHHKKCLDCGGTIKMINHDTYLKKFKYNFFQYDYLTGNYYRNDE